MAQSKLKAAVLAVGTEVTGGEILNSNSAWLSQRLEEQGVLVVAHMAVPDDDFAIQSALESLSQVASYIFTTGGLGPTSDDFTREIIARWSEKPLEFSDESWATLNDQLRRRGVPVREAHKKECFFPAKSLRLKNHAGTADGFLTDKGTTQIFGLPGPPREIKSMWESEILPVLRSHMIQKTEELRVWNCFGVPESEVAALVEKICEGSGLRVGYRASVPYVKVKVWFPIHKKHPLEKKIQESLQPWLRLAASEDPLELLLGHLNEGQSVRILDFVSGGRMTSRISDLCQVKPDLTQKIQLSLVTQFGVSAPDQGAAQQIFSAEIGKNRILKLRLRSRERELQKDVEIPTRLNPETQRGRFYLAEESFYGFLDLQKEALNSLG